MWRYPSMIPVSMAVAVPQVIYEQAIPHYYAPYTDRGGFNQNTWGQGRRRGGRRGGSNQNTRGQEGHRGGRRGGSNQNTWSQGGRRGGRRGGSEQSTWGQSGYRGDRGGSSRQSTWGQGGRSHRGRDDSRGRGDWDHSRRYGNSNDRNRRIKDQQWYTPSLGALIASKGLYEGEELKDYAKLLKKYISYVKKTFFAENNNEDLKVILALRCVKEQLYGQLLAMTKERSENIE